jgi:hypothetical protein
MKMYMPPFVRCSAAASPGCLKPVSHPSEASQPVSTYSRGLLCGGEQSTRLARAPHTHTRHGYGYGDKAITAHLLDLLTVNTVLRDRDALPGP